MEEQFQSESQQENVLVDVQALTSIKHDYPAKEQFKIYVLFAIKNKELSLGRRLFFDDIEKKLGISKTAYQLGLEFLDGSGLVVNEVIIVNAVPKELLERYGIL